MNTDRHGSERSNQSDINDMTYVALSIRRFPVAAVIVSFLIVCSSAVVHAQSNNWDITLSSGIDLHRVAIIELRPDSVMTDLVMSGYWIQLDSIVTMHHLKESFVGEGVTAGFLLGMLVGAVIPPGKREPSGGHGFVWGSDQLNQSFRFGLVGSLVGGVAGGFIDQDKDYNLRSMSRLERYELLQRILGD